MLRRAPRHRSRMSRKPLQAAIHGLAAPGPARFAPLRAGGGSPNLSGRAGLLRPAYRAISAGGFPQTWRRRHRESPPRPQGIWAASATRTGRRIRGRQRTRTPSVPNCRSPPRSARMWGAAGCRFFWREAGSFGSCSRLIHSIIFSRLRFVSHRARTRIRRLHIHIAWRAPYIQAPERVVG